MPTPETPQNAAPPPKPIDPDDDLDDLDDVLDQFEPRVQPKAAQADKLAAGEGDGGEEDLLSSEFANELLRGMYGKTSEPSASPAPPDNSFQAHIRRTVDKLKSSESDLTSSSDSLGADEDALLQQLEMLGLGKGEGSEAELQNALEAMMSQLMSKDVLYEPLKELDDKLPPYLTSHPELPASERERYEKQISCIKRMLEVFDTPNFDENDAKTSDAVVQLMTELQTYGSPPDEIMGPLPPGFMNGDNGLPDIPEGCVVC